MNKLQKAQEILDKKEIDGWLIPCNEQSDIHSPWLLGVKSHGRHMIYIDKEGNHRVISNQMEKPMIEKAIKKNELNMKVVKYKKTDNLRKMIKELMKDKKVALNYGERVYSNKGTGFADYLHHGEFLTLQNLCPTTQFVSAAPLIENLRSIKTSEELDDLRETAKATMEILEDLPNWVKIGMTEKEVQAKLEYEYRKIGEKSFDAIVAMGENSADPHHNSSKKKIGEGCLLVDSGLKMDKMCSDITWTFWVKSKPPQEFLDAYSALIEAKKEANKYFIGGEKHKTPAIKCREKLKDLGYEHEKLFIHGLGHSMGFETHDIGTSISWKAPEESFLKENMVYSNEPGLYWQGKWGIRLEDDIIVGKHEPEIVTKCPETPPRI